MLEVGSIFQKQFQIFQSKINEISLQICVVVFIDLVDLLEYCHGLVHQGAEIPFGRICEILFEPTYLVLAHCLQKLIESVELRNESSVVVDS